MGKGPCSKESHNLIGKPDRDIDNYNIKCYNGQMNKILSYHKGVKSCVTLSKSLEHSESIY